MNLIEASIDAMRRVAEANSEGGEVDSHWESVLPETQDIFANEVFLTLHRSYINESMKHRAVQIAQKAPLRDLRDLDDAKLVLHCWMREAWLGISDNQEFQALVDNNVKEVIYPPDPIRWVNASGMLLPLSEGTARQIHFSLIERYKQAHFAQHCGTELICRIQKNNVKKHMSILFTCSEEFPVERNKAYQWLREQSKLLVPDGGEDAMHDWLEKLSRLPLHIRMQKIGATLTAIPQLAIDIQRKGGKYKHVSLEDEHTDTIADESTKDPNEEIIDDEFSQILLAKQKKIEEILSRDSPEKRKSKIGKRRFQVMQILAQTPTLTSIEIAEKFHVSKQTIGRDRDKIRQSWAQICEVLYS